MEAVVRDVSRRHNWRHYAYNEDMVQDAMLALVRYAAQFDPARGTARTYVALVTRSAFGKTVQREKRGYAARLSAIRDAGALTERESDWLAHYEAS